MTLLAHTMITSSTRHNNIFLLFGWPLLPPIESTWVHCGIHRRHVPPPDPLLMARPGQGCRLPDQAYETALLTCVSS